MSNLGRRIYFPKGIIAQSAEAKQSAGTANGTIGMAFSKGSPLVLSAVTDNMQGFKPDESAAYAPTAGVEKTRKLWKEQMIKKNPSLNPAGISLPVVVPGLTAGLSYSADLFLNNGNNIIASEPCWDNYSLIYETRRQGNLIGIPFFGSENGLDLDAIRTAVEQQAKQGQVRIIFNFPNNPAGYSPTVKESEALVSLIRETAEKGTDVLVISDDAYFGLFYEADINKESLFANFAGLHENVLAIKIDGPTKEDYTWGMRCGFVTFGSKGLEEKHYEALVKKMMGTIRSSVSCSNTSAQFLMCKVYEDKRTQEEKNRFMAILQHRYDLVKGFIKANPDNPALKPLPFNSGYFMSFICTGINAETLRQELLSKHGIGVIALGSSCVRVAFSSIDDEKINSVYQVIYDVAAGLKK